MPKKIIALTGGAGYIGSHLAICLFNQGYQPLIIDNFANSNQNIIKKLEAIVNQKLPMYQIDINDREKINNVFKNNKIDAVIHLAAHKSIPESFEKPLDYYNNNINGLINTLFAMNIGNCNKIIFSSSCSVYSEKAEIPITENSKLEGNNPYSKSKIICEEILEQISKSDESFKYVSLRYFNPVGAHSSGIIGDRLDGKNSSLMSKICKIASCQNDHLTIFGNDYDTVDGTCIRDFIHINDLIAGHINALDNLSNLDEIPYINLGTGKGYSVLELIKTFERVNNVKVLYKFANRRGGDLEKIYADVTLANKILNWQAKENLESMCSSSWNNAKTQIIL